MTYTFDDLGNRTSMTDGMGSVSYEYNSLSQMTAETRSFADTLAVIRSSVFGGEIISETNNTGKKLRTYVRGEGRIIAWQAVFYPPPSGTVEQVRFEHYDATGSSRMMTQENGSTVAQLGIESDAAEFDPAGQSVGTENPYPNLHPPYPGEGCMDCGTSGVVNLDDNSKMYVNGRRISCTLDGSRIDCSQLRGLLENGSTLPEHLAGWQGVPGFRFDYGGVGIFRTTLPDVYQNNYGKWTRPPGSDPRREEGIRIFQGGSALFAVDWGWTPHYPRRVSVYEAFTLGSSIKRALDKTDGCRKYIKDLIERAAKNAGPNPDGIVDTDIEKLFLKVLTVRGGSGTHEGSGGVFIGRNGHTARSYWTWVGGPGYAEVELGYGWYANPAEVLGTDRAGMAAVHELVHVALRSLRGADDLAMANAAADLAGVERPKFSFDESKPIGPDNQPINLAASAYWGERLNQACGYPSHISNQFTNHKLYK